MLVCYCYMKLRDRVKQELGAMRILLSNESPGSLCECCKVPVKYWVVGNLFKLSRILVHIRM